MDTLRKYLDSLEHPEITLTAVEKALAHLQADRVVSKLHVEYLMGGHYFPPYGAFTSDDQLTVGDTVTRDYSKWHEDKGGFSIFPRHLKIAKDGDTVEGTVIEVGEKCGFYLYVDHEPKF